ncbi:MAG: hypothetical protein KDA81_04455 [Planctomycetaceae bacterium]|nr:hypothetical protein [Planctomycetaceae bacterium]
MNPSSGISNDPGSFESTTFEGTNDPGDVVAVRGADVTAGSVDSAERMHVAAVMPMTMIAAARGNELILMRFATTFRSGFMVCGFIDVLR